ncbi:hypothetical protein D1012_21615 [Pseudotabrizicola alkalilacus]|uniref:Uncharacterized protein n=2 Tax=Pseudotabrizicola alkalilacus TaxID=2305252 RepID=A0A411YWB3_9RHOB|nr:hypothetical protein D1012_21615 [Pseudotabrizicola alkalilacus]
MFPQGSPKLTTPITMPIAKAITPMLDALAPKPKASLTARDVVEMNRTAILGALQKGYNFTDIAEKMVAAGVKISASTLAHYVRDKGPTAQTIGAAKEKAKASSPQPKTSASQPAPAAMNQPPRADDGSATPAQTQGAGHAPSPAPQASRLPG